jgi:hypothetical protein
MNSSYQKIIFLFELEEVLLSFEMTKLPMKYVKIKKIFKG